MSFKREWTDTHNHTHLISISSVHHHSGTPHAESPLERFQRLKFETQQLIDDLADLHEQLSRKDLTGPVFPVDLLAELKGLQVIQSVSNEPLQLNQSIRLNSLVWHWIRTGVHWGEDDLVFLLSIQSPLIIDHRSSVSPSPAALMNHLESSPKVNPLLCAWSQFERTFTFFVTSRGSPRLRQSPMSLFSILLSTKSQQRSFTYPTSINELLISSLSLEQQQRYPSPQSLHFIPPPSL